MSGTCWYLAGAVALSLFVQVNCAAQAPSIPPDVQSILEKAQSGKPLTDAESKRIEQFANSMQAPAQAKGSSPAAGLRSATPCPPTRAAEIAAAAPTRAEYVALLKSLVATYGKRLGKHQADFDRLLAAPGAESSGPQMGAVLFISGAAGASVYTSAVAALRAPDDLQAANNLGVALDSIPDYKAATAVLLYVRKWATRAPLPAVNLGWSYFNSGHSAQAKAQFQEGALLGPDLPGPGAGLGMLAACRGDTATAMAQFRNSLSKGYSRLVAGGFLSAQKAREDAKADPPKPFPPSDSDEFDPIPELPASDDPDVTAAAEPAFDHALNFADKRIQAAAERIQDAQERVKASIRRSQRDPDGAIDMPRTFDKQLFEYAQIQMLTVGQVVMQEADSMDQVSQRNEPLLKQMTDQALLDGEKISAIHEKKIVAAEKHIACIEGGGDADACNAAEEKETAPLDQQEQEISYRLCKQTKEVMETEYAQHFKVWKQYSTSMSASSRDFYAYSQPVIDQVWAPALNDLMQATRELAVLSLYKQGAGYASALAGMAKGSKELKCVPPAPPKPPKAAEDPKLKTKKSDCPLDPPFKIGLVVVKMELGCDHVKLSGGEVLQFEVERNFVKKETAFSVGVGASASLPSISLGGGGDLGDNGSSWTPPGLEAKASVDANVMVTVRVNDQGDVQDLALKSTVSASGSAGPASGSLGLTGTISLENGAAVAPIIEGNIGGQ